MTCKNRKYLEGYKLRSGKIIVLYNNSYWTISITRTISPTNLDHLVKSFIFLRTNHPVFAESTRELYIYKDYE